MQQAISMAHSSSLIYIQTEAGSDGKHQTPYHFTCSVCKLAFCRECADPAAPQGHLATVRCPSCGSEMVLITASRPLATMNWGN